MYASLIGWGIKYVLPALLIVGLVSWAGYQAYDTGRDVERAVWLEIQADNDAMHIAELEALQAAAEIAAAQHLLRIEEIRDAKQKAVAELRHDVAVVAARGLFVKAKNCDSGKAKASDPGGGGGGTSRQRLHEETERNLIALTEEADEVVIQYEGCRAELLNHVEVLD